jgi:predicted nucleotidyltransferase
LPSLQYRVVVPQPHAHTPYCKPHNQKWLPPYLALSLRTLPDKDSEFVRKHRQILEARKVYFCKVIFYKNIFVMNTIIVDKLKTFFSTYPIEKAWIFGSYARGEETKKSDLDILVRFNENAKISLFDYVRILDKMEKLLHKKVDMVSEGGIMTFAKESIDNDKILIYERNG